MKCPLCEEKMDDESFGEIIFFCFDCGSFQKDYNGFWFFWRERRESLGPETSLKKIDDLVRRMKKLESFQ